MVVGCRARPGQSAHPGHVDAGRRRHGVFRTSSTCVPRRRCSARCPRTRGCTGPSARSTPPPSKGWVREAMAEVRPCTPPPSRPSLGEVDAVERPSVPTGQRRAWACSWVTPRTPRSSPSSWPPSSMGSPPRGGLLVVIQWGQGPGHGRCAKVFDDAAVIQRCTCTAPELCRPSAPGRARMGRRPPGQRVQPPRSRRRAAHGPRWLASWRCAGLTPPRAFARGCRRCSASLSRCGRPAGSHASPAPNPSSP
jgi:hypothetical protein